MAHGYSLETFFRVYDDSSGSYYEVRPDTDGLSCVEVTYTDDKTLALERCLTVPPEMAQLLAQALIQVAKSISEQEK